MCPFVAQSQQLKHSQVAVLPHQVISWHCLKRLGPI